MELLLLFNKLILVLYFKISILSDPFLDQEIEMSSGGCYILSGLFGTGVSTSKIGSYSNNRYFSGSWVLYIMCHPVGPFHIACISYSMVVSDKHISYMVSGTEETGEGSCLTNQGLHPGPMQHHSRCICMPRFSHSTQSIPGGGEINVTP